MILCLSPNGEVSHEADGPPTTLLIGTVAGVIRLERDGPGSPWRTVGQTLQDKHVAALAPLPGDVVFAGCHDGGGLFRSRDGGRSWQDVGASIADRDIYTLAVLRGSAGPSIVVGTGPANIYRSEDLGDTWREFPAIKTLPGAEFWTFPPPPHAPHVKSITPDQNGAESFYACVEQGALLWTGDGGRNWTQLEGMWSPDDEAYHDAHRILIAPWDPNLFILTTGLGAHRSTDGGRSWSRAHSLDAYIGYPDGMVAAPHDKALFVSGPVNPPRDWLAGQGRGRVCRSDDGGATWHPADAGLDPARTANFEALSIASYPSGYSLFVADTDGEIFASEDASRSWQRIAVTPAVSKAGHHKIQWLAKKLPRPLSGIGAALMRTIIRVSSQRAGRKRRAAFAR